VTSYYGDPAFAKKTEQPMKDCFSKEYAKERLKSINWESNDTPKQVPVIRIPSKENKIRLTDCLRSGETASVAQASWNNLQ